MVKYVLYFPRQTINKLEDCDFYFVKFIHKSGFGKVFVHFYKRNANKHFQELLFDFLKSFSFFIFKFI